MLTREEKRRGEKQTNCTEKREINRQDGNTEEKGVGEESIVCQIEITGYEKRPILVAFFCSKDFLLTGIDSEKTLAMDVSV